MTKKIFVMTSLFGFNFLYFTSFWGNGFSMITFISLISIIALDEAYSYLKNKQSVLASLKVLILGRTFVGGDPLSNPVKSELARQIFGTGWLVVYILLYTLPVILKYVPK